MVASAEQRSSFTRWPVRWQNCDLLLREASAKAGVSPQQFMTGALCNKNKYNMLRKSQEPKLDIETAARLCEEISRVLQRQVGLDDVIEIVFDDVRATKTATMADRVQREKLAMVGACDCLASGQRLLGVYASSFFGMFGERVYEPLWSEAKASKHGKTLEAMQRMRCKLAQRAFDTCGARVAVSAPGLIAEIEAWIERGLRVEIISAGIEKRLLPMLEGATHPGGRAGIASMTVLLDRRPRRYSLFASPRTSVRVAHGSLSGATTRPVATFSFQPSSVKRDRAAIERELDSIASDVGHDSAQFRAFVRDMADGLRAISHASKKQPNGPEGTPSTGTEPGTGEPSDQGFAARKQIFDRLRARWALPR